MQAPADDALIRHALDQARLLAGRLPGRQRSDLDGDPDFFAILCWRMLELTAATAQVSAELQGRFPIVLWRELLGLRRRLIHGQPSLDRDVIWLILTRDLPLLVPALEAILAAGAGDQG